MVKWLICFLWGHDLNNDPLKLINLRDNGQLVESSSQCSRCLKYKIIYSAY